MADSRETGPAVARTCLGGLTLLLALTLSVRAVGVSSAPMHSPAVAHAVARFFAGAAAEAPDAAEQRVVLVSVRAATRGELPPATEADFRADAGLLLELLNLPPPACA